MGPCAPKPSFARLEAYATKSPRRKPGDSGLHAFPVAMLRGLEPAKHLPSCGMDGGMVFGPGVPGLPPGASWTAPRKLRPGVTTATPLRPRAPPPTKSPRRKPGDSGSPASPLTMRHGFEPRKHLPSCGMDDGLAFGPGVPGLPPGASWNTHATHTKSPRREPGDSGFHPFPVAMLRGLEPANHLPSCGMDGGMAFGPGVPGLPPGASRNTHATHTKSPRRKPGDSGLHAFPVAMLRGPEPGKHLPSCGMDDGLAFVPGVPGLPPGASWTTHAKPRSDCGLRPDLSAAAAADRNAKNSGTSPGALSAESTHPTVGRWCLAGSAAPDSASSSSAGPAAVA